MNKKIIIILVVCVLLLLLFGLKMYKTSSYDTDTFKGVNSACPCTPTQLLKTGMSGGLIVPNIKVLDANAQILISLFNNNTQPMYVSGVAQLTPGTRSVFIDNMSIAPNTILQYVVTSPQLVAGVLYIASDALSVSNSNVTSLKDPDPLTCLRIEMDIYQTPDKKWVNGGDISYVYGINIPALLYFGPSNITGVDASADSNNKLAYTTCPVSTLIADCPTMVNANNTCIGPDLYCQNSAPYNKDKNWSTICDDTTGDMSTYIKAFGLDKINPNLYTNSSDKTNSTLSRFIYNNSNPFNYKPPGSKFVNGNDMGSFYWPNNSTVPATTDNSYTWSDNDQSELFVGTVDANNNIAGGPSNIQPAPPGPRTTAFNNVMNGWAISRGMCDPAKLLTNCGGQDNDYMARYTTQQVGDGNNYTKGTDNLAGDTVNGTSAWHTGKFPDNRYARYMSEHSHNVYGFPYDEGKTYGGFTISNQPDAPQMCIVLFPTCTNIDNVQTTAKTVVVVQGSPSK